jgi:hypothetical protein
MAANYANGNSMDFLIGALRAEGEYPPGSVLREASIAAQKKPRQSARHDPVRTSPVRNPAQATSQAPTPAAMPATQPVHPVVPPAVKFTSASERPGAPATEPPQGGGTITVNTPAEYRTGPEQRKERGGDGMRQATEQELRPLQRNQLDTSLKLVMSEHPNKEYHFRIWTSLLEDAGVFTTDKSVNAGLARLERDRVWGVVRTKAGTYMWKPEDMLVASLDASAADARSALRGVVRRQQIGAVPATHHRGPVTPLPGLPRPSPVPAPVPVPDPAAPAEVPQYDRRSVFRFSGYTRNGGLILADSDGMLFRAEPL